jgi:riboflavin kinase/FMN adenylyltransferase
VATIGFFDGVHRGHRFLIDQVRQVAAAKGLESALITFSEHPAGIIAPQSVPPLLTTLDEKIVLLKQMEVDACRLLHFTLTLSQLSAYGFMRDVLKERYHVKCLLVGHDHRFGHDRKEGFEDYRRYGKEIGMEVIQADAFVSEEGQRVCSSLIRSHLQRGEVTVAASLLGYSYFLQGIVVRGFRVGHQIGFPTANLKVDADKLIPSNGVYAVIVTVLGRQYAGMLNIGYRPTFDNELHRTVEVHLLHFDEEIYDEIIRLSFVRFLRPEVKFPSVEALVAQLRLDAAAVESLHLSGCFSLHP